MDKDKQVDEFLDGLNNDGTNNNDPFAPAPDPFAEPGDKTPDDGGEGEGGEGTKEKDKVVPFHEDPKILRFIEKQVEKRTKQFAPKEVETFKKEVGDDVDLVAAFTQIIGNDTPEKVNALNMLKKSVDDLNEKATSATRLIQQREEADRQAEEDLAQGFDDVEETFNVDITSNAPIAKKTRAEFSEFIKRVAPKDGSGNVVAYPDFTETFKLFQESRTKPKAPIINRAKDLADRGMQRTTDASTIPVDRDYSWRGVDKALKKITRN